MAGITIIYPVDVSAASTADAKAKGISLANGSKNKSECDKQKGYSSANKTTCKQAYDAQKQKLTEARTKGEQLAGANEKKSACGKLGSKAQKTRCESAYDDKKKELAREVGKSEAASGKLKSAACKNSSFSNSEKTTCRNGYSVEVGVIRGREGANKKNACSNALVFNVNQCIKGYDGGSGDSGTTSEGTVSGGGNLFEAACSQPSDGEDIKKSSICADNLGEDNPIAGGKDGILYKATILVSSVAGIIAIIMMIIAGINMITAGGDSQKFAKGRNTIIFAIVGLIIIVLARSIVTFVVTRTSA